jgi:hypothetical protein
MWAEDQSNSDARSHLPVGSPEYPDLNAGTLWLQASLISLLPALRSRDKSLLRRLESPTHPAVMRELSALYCALACDTGRGKESATRSADCPFSPFSHPGPRGETWHVRIWEWSPVGRKGKQHGIQFCSLLALPSRVLPLCQFSQATVTQDSSDGLSEA